ncbi:hypothetical protein DPMN_172923 [Dreissena polymorpha]|uniref:Uncharacterized protein n=1 Tax=Dreissena polymorpha TaxID=45954 RepID=A0A9D4E0N6_DREPO|nr:hypothetical protein DPMN_172923 [Dreissena polymorpha]
MEHYIKGFDKKPEDSTVKAFQVLKKRCQGKLLFIDNQSNKEIKEEMVWNILTAVDTANAQSLRPYFSNKLTRQMEKRAQDFHWMHVSGLGLERSKEGNNIIEIKNKKSERY